jgi:hypothetical protein
MTKWPDDRASRATGTELTGLCSMPGDRHCRLHLSWPQSSEVEFPCLWIQPCVTSS